MLTLLFVISIIADILLIMCNNLLCVLTCIVSVVLLFFICLLGYEISTDKCIINEINLYKDKKKKIETNVEWIVKQHPDYNAKLFKEIVEKGGLEAIAYSYLKINESVLNNYIDDYKKCNYFIFKYEEERIKICSLKWLIYLGKKLLTLKSVCD